MRASARSAKPEVGALTGLRGVAACYVVLYHFFRFETELPGHIQNIAGHGYISVDLFFVLSGFVLALQYSEGFHLSPTLRTHAAFLWRRFARIYPLYILVTIALVLFDTSSEPSARMLATNVLLIQAWGLAFSICGPAWSISTEAASYLLYPLLIVPSLFRGPRTALALAAIVGLTFVLLVNLPASARLPGDALSTGPLDLYNPFTPWPVVRCLAGFTLGLLAFRVAPLFSNRGGWIANLATIAVVVSLAFKQADLVLVFLFFILVADLAAEASLAGRVLNTSIARWLGEISYSIYLLHQPIQKLTQNTVTSVLTQLHVPHAFSLAILVVFLIVLCVSSLSYQLIEKRSRRALLAFTRSKRVVLGSEPASP